MMKTSNIFQRKGLIVLVSIFTIISCAKKQNNQNISDETTKTIQHQKIYYEEGRFAGWPANNGIWNWGDEILVGFVEAAHRETEGFHTYDQETARNKYARSLDGGEIWTIEDAYESGMTGFAYDHSIPEDQADLPKTLAQPI